MESLPENQKLPVVVGVDGPPTKFPIVDVAAAEAEHHHVPLIIVHAWPGRYSNVPRDHAVSPRPEQGRHLLDIAVQRAEHVAPGVPVRAELSDDTAAETLVRWSRYARLLVVGHRDDPGIRRGWGSTAAYLTHHSACPLLVQRGFRLRQGPVVLAASGRTTATVVAAAEAADRAGCRLVAVHVRAGSEPVTWPDVPADRVLIEERDVPYTLDRASRRGRLLVAGQGRKGWLAEMLYSMVGTTVGGLQACPVLFVPPQAGQEPAR
ncbi:universal stress protein [Actinoplanes sp. NBRC 101535]|uniref:universal stress protein n=1 Tax=Actinoplanes sp. NBRC 101535 TaxID=3032196 RepID=UPI0024A03D4D|nr:universal stress protein [Actinoplanes sp. NBRC 101535]GLY06432.1 universal stress protein [Actinoplanes sp. NBRC 101535]